MGGFGVLGEHQPVLHSAGHLRGEMSEFVIPWILRSKKTQPQRSQETQEGIAGDPEDGDKGTWEETAEFSFPLAFIYSSSNWKFIVFF